MESEKPKPKKPIPKKLEIRGVLEALCRMLYGRRWQVELAEDLKVSTHQVRRWQKDSSSVPRYVLYGLERIVVERRAACDRIAVYLDDPLFCFKARPSSIKDAKASVAKQTSVDDRAASVARGRAFAEARMTAKAASAMKPAAETVIQPEPEQDEVLFPDWLIIEHFETTVPPMQEPEQATLPLSKADAAAPEFRLGRDDRPSNAAVADPSRTEHRSPWSAGSLNQPPSPTPASAAPATVSAKPRRLTRKAREKILALLGATDVRNNDDIVLKPLPGTKRERAARIYGIDLDGSLHMSIEVKSQRWKGGFKYDPSEFLRVTRRPSIEFVER